ncbi:hypothetical protein [Solemya pervernicosa gill symbiont]|nr:hypothetical protein [Solemya pervernicosa gill symbiont]
MSNIYIYQIYYDELSKSKLLPEFIPLDNTSNKRPDWFEFLVILNFLRENEPGESLFLRKFVLGIQAQANSKNFTRPFMPAAPGLTAFASLSMAVSVRSGDWYGFLSPKFQRKTQLDPQHVIQMIKENSQHANVALFSPGWDQNAFFKNPWEQGEIWHPGITQLSQDFVSYLNLDIDLESLVTDSYSAVFSNYVIAKKEYWVEWKRIPQKSFLFSEENKGKLGSSQNTSYSSSRNQYPMKTFIQERFASLILTTGEFQVLSPDTFIQSMTGKVFKRLFQDSLETRKLLAICDLLKSKYRKKSGSRYFCGSLFWASKPKQAANT